MNEAYINMHIARADKENDPAYTARLQQFYRQKQLWAYALAAALGIVGYAAYKEFS